MPNYYVCDMNRHSFKNIMSNRINNLSLFCLHRKFFESHLKHVVLLLYLLLCFDIKKSFLFVRKYVLKQYIFIPSCGQVRRLIYLADDHALESREDILQLNKSNIKIIKELKVNTSVDR